mgnify:CR=1 FL=1
MGKLIDENNWKYDFNINIFNNDSDRDNGVNNINRGESSKSGSKYENILNIWKRKKT